MGAENKKNKLMFFQRDRAPVLPFLSFQLFSSSNHGWWNFAFARQTNATIMNNRCFKTGQDE
jgi:hypothetical protein